MGYADLLREYIKQSRLTLDEISAELEKRGLTASKQYLSRLQNGKTAPASEKMNRALAEVTNGDPEELIIEGYIEKAPNEVKEKFSALHENKKDKTESDHREVPERQLRVFSERLKSGVNESGQPIHSIAAKCNITTEYLETLMHNPKRIPGIRTLYTLADIFDVTPDYLGGYVNEPTGRSPETPKPKDLKELLNEEVMFDGIPVTDDSKQRILGFMESMFWDAKQKNKRKK